MPKITKTLNNLDMPTEEELQIIDEYVNSKPEVKKMVDSLKDIMSQHFCFGTEEIKVYIYNICKDLEDKTVQDFNALYTAFAENDIKTFDSDERKGIARGIINDSIALYKSENAKISEEFIEVLEEARSRNIDPFKLAIKTNMKTASVEKFSNTIYALAEKKYVDSNAKTEESLLKGAELNEVLEQCASLAFKATEDAVSQILSLLNGLFWNEEKQGYTYDVREIIRSAPSILLSKPEDIAETIGMLELFYAEDGKEALLARIKRSPSLLTINFTKVSKFGKVYASAIEKIVAQKKEKTSTQKNTAVYAQEISDKFIMNIDHLTQIEKLKLEHIEEISEILTKYLGEDNAVTCMQNMTVLYSNPAFLECMLASIVQEEGLTGSTELRQYFVKNPYSALTKVEISAEQSVRRGDQEADNIEFKKAEKEKVEIKAFPNVFITNTELEKIKKRAGNRNTGLTQDLLEKMKKTAEEAERKAREEAERIAREQSEADALRRQTRNDERRRKKEEERMRKRLARSGGGVQNQQPTLVQPQPSLSSAELTLEERQEIRRGKIKLPAPLSENYNKKDVLRILYAPIIDAFTDNGFYPKNFRGFNEMCKAYENLVEGLEVSRSTYNSICTLNAHLKALTYDFISQDKYSNLLDRIVKVDTNGQCELSKIIDEAQTVLNTAQENEKYYSRAMKAMNDCVKRSKDGLIEEINTEENLFLKYITFRTNLASYIDSLEDTAEEFFGKEYEKIFFNKEREGALQNIVNLIQENLNPKSYNALIIDIYTNDYFKIIFDELFNKEILSVTDETEKNSRGTESVVKRQIRISATKCTAVGIDRDLVLKFCELYKNLNHFALFKCDKLGIFIEEGNVLNFTYKDDKKSGELQYMDIAPNSDKYTGLPPLALFSSLRQEYTVKNNNDEGDGENN